MYSENEEEKTPKQLLIGIIERRDKEALHAWIERFLKVRIPRVAITHGNNSPFDFVADYLFGDISFAVVMANRSGGKTYIFGVLSTILSFLMDNTEIATVGAIQQQALKSYEYFQSFTSLFPFAYNLDSTTMRESKLLNGSKYNVLAGTMSGVNSPHPQLLFLDEIDLMAWQVLQQALSMPQSKHGVQARTVLTSTRKFAGGVMQRMLDEAINKNYRVYKWNIWEVMQPLPVDNPQLMRQIEKVFGNELPPGLENADGYYFWEDLIIKRSTLDDEAWQTEWVCSRPGLKGVIYGGSYSDENNLIVREPDEIEYWKPPARGFIYLAEDFGHSKDHPNVILPVWIPTTYDRLVVFDELYTEDHATDDLWRAVNEMLAPYGHSLPDAKIGVKGTIKGWACDPHNLALIHERRVRGAPIMDNNPDPKLYHLENSIPIMRRFLKAGRIMYSEKCPNLRLETLSYQYRKNADGTFSKTPKKDQDHGPDALRYLILAIGESVENNWIKKTYNKQPKRPETAPKDDILSGIKRNIGNNREAPITAGMLDMEF